MSEKDQPKIRIICNTPSDFGRIAKAMEEFVFTVQERIKREEIENNDVALNTTETENTEAA